MLTHEHVQITVVEPIEGIDRRETVSLLVQVQGTTRTSDSEGPCLPVL